MKTLPAIILAAACGGCTIVNVSDPASGRRVVHAVVPAWPWQDSAQSVQKLTVAGTTNKTTVSLSGLSQTETTSTNFTSILESVVSAAVRAAK